MRWILVACVLSLATVGVPAAAKAEPSSCDDAWCTPGVASGLALGASCEDTGRFVFGTTSWVRLVLCGSTRRYEPRYFMSPPMMGVKDEHAVCQGLEARVAQAPDGLFLSCVSIDGTPRWVRGDA
jgi:hypothetical protein